MLHLFIQSSVALLRDSFLFFFKIKNFLLLQGTNDKETHLLFCDLQHTNLVISVHRGGKNLVTEHQPSSSLKRVSKIGNLEQIGVMAPSLLCRCSCRLIRLEAHPKRFIFRPRPPFIRLVGPK